MHYSEGLAVLSLLQGWTEEDHLPCARLRNVVSAHRECIASPDLAVIVRFCDFAILISQVSPLCWSRGLKKD